MTLNENGCWIDSDELTEWENKIYSLHSTFEEDKKNKILNPCKGGWCCQGVNYLKCGFALRVAREKLTRHDVEHRMTAAGPSEIISIVKLDISVNEIANYVKNKK
jgi:hypothetical protein